MVHAPVALSVYVLAIAVVTVVVIAHVSHLSVRVPVVWGACALVALRWAIAIEPISNVAVAINSVFFSAPVLDVIWISFGDSSEKPVFVYLVVSLNGSNSPVISLLPDKTFHDLVPWEEMEHNAIKPPVLEAIE